MSVRRAVFFDLDDTLCDAATAFNAGRATAFAEAQARVPGLTAEALNDAWRQVHADLLPRLEAGVLTMAQVRDRRFRQMLATLGRPDDALADQLNDLLGATQLARLRRFDDVAALDALRARGVFVGVITNGADDAQADSQRSKAERVDLLGALDGFWVSDTMGYRKPDPRAFAPALAAVGGAPAESLYVGDSLTNDIAGANAAGLRGVLLLREPAERPDVSRQTPQPWRVVQSLWEMLSLLDEQ